MRILTVFLTATAWILFTGPAQAHFGMVIPSRATVGATDKTVTLTLSFSHPFEGKGMDMAQPRAFYVLLGDRKVDLTGKLGPARVMEHQAWSMEYRFRRPAVARFVMVPQPYWEEAEDLFIVHFTKTIVGVFGEDQGWDRPVGLPMEIVPLTRPFGNYAGNSFSGRVLADGKPLAGATVEVEFYNRDHGVRAPSDYHVTQEIRTDEQGVFTFACPWPGWWGFAALREKGTMKDEQGRDKPVEQGGVLWIRMDGARP